MPAGGAACNDLVCSQPILDCIPACCNSRGYSQERVVLAQTFVGAKRALIVPILPLIDAGRPLVQQPTGTLVTRPPRAQITAGCDLPVSQVLILGRMPLPLQLWSQ